MSETSLGELENVQAEAYESFSQAQNAVQEAAEQVTAANDACREAEIKYWNGEISEDEWDAAQQAMLDANAAQKAANENLEAKAKEAQTAADAVEAKKQELRDNRANDTSYVVHCARIECPFGMRESYLALEKIHGVLAHQIPQMTVKDVIANTNIINFGGCHSRENPEVQEAIENANAIIEEKKDWRDNVVDFFTKQWDSQVSKVKKRIQFGKKLLGIEEEEKSEEEKIEEMRSDFVGQCTLEFPENEEWIEGHEKVFINGEPVLLRRCSLMCNYGGCVTILVSGQPE